MRFVMQAGRLVEALHNVNTINEVGPVMDAYLNLTPTVAEGFLHISHHISIFEVFILALIFYFGWKGIKWFLEAYREEKDSRIEVVGWARS